MEPNDRQTQLDARTQHRAYVLDHVAAGSLTIEQATRILGLSTRQVGRLLARYAEDPTALAHGNRGRPPANRLDDTVRTSSSSSPGRPTPGSTTPTSPELLAEREGIAVAERTLRRILAEAGLAPVRRRRPARHRSRRERMPRAGLLLQVDGSRHDWLERRGPILTLVGGIDDATSTVTGATFRLAEDAAGYFTMLTQTATDYGLPGAVYSDRHGIFIVEKNRPPTLAEQLAGKQSFTQVGRALAELEVGWIGARSPQAKGRIERLWGTLQSRLISELRLAGATTIDDANVVLAAYLRRHNERFAVPPADAAPAWRPVPDGVTPEAVLCFHYRRRVANDATISWPGDALALPRRRDGRSWAGRPVIVGERLDGSLWVDHEGELHPLRAAPPDAGQLRARGLTAASGATLPAEVISWPRPRSRRPSSTRPRLPGGPGATTRGVAIGTGTDDRIAGRLMRQSRWPATPGRSGHGRDPRPGDPVSRDHPPHGFPDASAWTFMNPAGCLTVVARSQPPPPVDGVPTAEAVGELSGCKVGGAVVQQPATRTDESARATTPAGAIRPRCSVCPMAGHHHRRAVRPR